MKTIEMKAELNWNGAIKVITNEVSYEDKHVIQKLLNESINQSVYNDQLIINDFKRNVSNPREFTFTVQYNGNLKSALIYSEFNLQHDIEDLTEAYRAFKTNSKPKTKNFDLNPAEGEFGLVFDDKTVAQFTSSFKIVSKKKDEYKLQENFKKEYCLNDTEFDYIAALAA